jgi:PAS domain-containing protein
MGFELSHDVLKAAQLATDLRESEQRMALATDAAKVGLWKRDLARNEIWANDTWRSMFGVERVVPLNFESFIEKLHPEDRETVRRDTATAATPRTTAC